MAPPKTLSATGELLGVMLHQTAGPNIPPLSGEDERKRTIGAAEALWDGETEYCLRFDVSYNWFVSRGGHVLELRTGTINALARGVNRSTPHTQDLMQNLHLSSVLLEGSTHLPGYEMPEPQWNALRELCGYLCSKQNPPLPSIYAYHACQESCCPTPWLLQAVMPLRIAICSNRSGFTLP